MNFDETVHDYEPSQQAIDIVRQAKIVLLVGIAGAGKDTIKQELLKSSDYMEIVSHTTRLPRRNNGTSEQNGVDYHFIDQVTAQSMIAQKAFVEIKHVHGDTVYGTSITEIQRAYDAQKISITDIDIQGVQEYKDISPHAVAIFILPPSYDTWRARLSARYETTEAFIEEWPKRRQSALRELERALTVPYFHFIINDDLMRTVQIADEIARQSDVFHRKDDEARIAARDLLENLKTRD